MFSVTRIHGTVTARFMLLLPHAVPLMSPSSKWINSTLKRIRAAGICVMKRWFIAPIFLRFVLFACLLACYGCSCWLEDLRLCLPVLMAHTPSYCPPKLFISIENVCRHRRWYQLMDDVVRPYHLSAPSSSQPSTKWKFNQDKSGPSAVIGWLAFWFLFLYKHVYI